MGVLENTRSLDASRYFKSASIRRSADLRFASSEANRESQATVSAFLPLIATALYRQTH